MEVVVAFTDGTKSSEEVIARSVLVVERLVSEPMGERVDAESGLHVSSHLVAEKATYMMNEDQPGGSGKEKSTSPVSPA
jgi:hypothetical protein